MRWTRSLVLALGFVSVLVLACSQTSDTRSWNELNDFGRRLVASPTGAELTVRAVGSKAEIRFSRQRNWLQTEIPLPDSVSQSRAEEIVAKLRAHEMYFVSMEDTSGQRVLRGDAWPAPGVLQHVSFTVFTRIFGLKKGSQFQLSGSVLRPQEETLLDLQGQWNTRDFGIGVVSYSDMYQYEVQDVVLSRPTINADTLAVLNGRILCITGMLNCLRAFGAMIEFDYEIPGWAVLSLNADSTWAEVLLNPWTSDLRGWVELQPGRAQVLFWSDILPGQYPVYFLAVDPSPFFARPSNEAARHSLVPPEGYERFMMRPMRVSGNWMQVEVHSSWHDCAPGPREVRRDTAWIKYLSDSGRPNVYYFSRGC